MKCYKCGKELPDNIDICPFCGADLNELHEEMYKPPVKKNDFSSDAATGTESNKKPSKRSLADIIDGRDDFSEDYAVNPQTAHAIEIKDEINNNPSEDRKLKGTVILKNKHKKEISDSDNVNDNNSDEQSSVPDEDYYTDAPSTRHSIKPQKMTAETMEEQFAELDEANGKGYSKSVYAPQKPVPGTLPESTYSKVLKGLAAVGAAFAVALVAMYFI